MLSPLVGNYHPQVVVGKMAEDAELWKYSKHLVSCEQAGYGFQSLAVGVASGMALKSRGLLRFIWTRLIQLGEYPSYDAAATCLRQVSFAALLGVVRNCIACSDGVLD